MLLSGDLSSSVLGPLPEASRGDLGESGKGIL